MHLITAIMNQRRWQSKLLTPAGCGPVARCSSHIFAARPRRTSSLRLSAGCVESAAPAGRRRRNPSHRSGAGECNRHCDNNTATTTKNPTAKFAVGQVIETIRWKPSPPQSNHDQGFAGICSLFRAVQPKRTCGRPPGLWLRATFLRLPTQFGQWLIRQRPCEH